MAIQATRRPFSEQGPFDYLALSGMAPCCSYGSATRPLGPVRMHRIDGRPATLQFRGTQTRTPTPAPTFAGGGESEPGHQKGSRLGAKLEVLPIILQLTSDTSRTASAWTLTYLVFMRMPAPTCQGHRYIGAPFAPIGSERRRSPLPPPRPEVRWSTCRLPAPADCRVGRIEREFNPDFLDSLAGTKDRSRTFGQDRGTSRLPDPPRPDSPDVSRGGLPGCCPTPRPAHLVTGAAIPRDPAIPDLCPLPPRASVVPPVESTRRPVGDLTDDSDDQGPAAVWARRAGWHHTYVPQVDKAQRCHSMRCPCGRLRTPVAPSGRPGGNPPTTPGGGSSPTPSRWNISRTQKGESGGTINVSARTLEEAYLLMVAATGERGWGRVHEDLTKDPGLCSDRIHRRE